MCNWGRNGPQPLHGESSQDYKRRCNQYNLEQHNAMASQQQTPKAPEQETAPTSTTITTHDETDDESEYLGPFRLTYLEFTAHLATPPASSASPFREYTTPNNNRGSQFDGIIPRARTITSHLREPTPDDLEPNITAPGLGFDHQPRTHRYQPGPYEFLEFPAVPAIPNYKHFIPASAELDIAMHVDFTHQRRAHQYQPAPFNYHGLPAAAAIPINNPSITPNTELNIAIDLYDDQPGADGHDWLLTAPLSPPQARQLQRTTQPTPRLSGLKLSPPQPRPLRRPTTPPEPPRLSALELAVQVNERHMKWVTERFECRTDKDKRPDYLSRYTWGSETTKEGETREGWRRTLFYNRERQSQEEYDYGRERSMRLE
ncbi:hypothetical protein GE09DRAFT_1156875 [Coniochaeta sp. 2T2.1]|nr:hypothetical protein GE09DRAFT_1156875 [Coniochaeta sp. 2T2.1]